MALSVRNNLLIVLSILLGAISGSAAECSGAGPYRGMWSRRSTLACAHQRVGGLVQDGRRLTIASRNGKRLIRIEGTKWTLEIEGRSSAIDKEGIGWPAELSWAPSGKYFYVTEGLGSTTGFRTRVYAVSDSGAVTRLRDFNDALKGQFDQKFYCKENYPNVVGLEWLDDDRLVVVAQSPDRGDCDVRGELRGYVLKLPDASVEKEFTARELKTKFGSSFGRSLLSSRTASR